MDLGDLVAEITVHYAASLLVTMKLVKEDIVTAMDALISNNLRNYSER